MHYRPFIVIFVTGIQVKVDACCKAEAKILAQAEQIKQGKRYEVLSVLGG